MVFGFINRNYKGLVVGAGAFASVYGITLIINDRITNVQKYEGFDQDLPAAEDDRQKVYLVTGANSGIGKTLVSKLASKKNCKVYMLCRDMDSCETIRSSIVRQSGNKYVYCRPCDLASLKSVRECAQMIKDKEEIIDGLVNNAGVMYAPKSTTEDGMEIHWGTNHLGPFLLTKLLSDRLENGDGRVLYMVNLDYRKAREGINFEDINMVQKYDKSYAFYQSQLANVLTMRALAEEWKTRGISVNAVYPGLVSSTRIKRHMGLDKSMVSGPFVKKVMGSFTEVTPENAIHTPLFLLTDRSVTGMTGKMFANMNEMAVLDVGLDDEAGKKLMLIDEYWTGLKSKEDIAVKKK